MSGKSCWAICFHLYSHNKVAKEYIFKTAFQKDKSEPDSLTKNNPYFET